MKKRKNALKNLYILKRMKYGKVSARYQKLVYHWCSGNKRQQSLRQMLEVS